MAQTIAAEECGSSFEQKIKEKDRNVARNENEVSLLLK
jgi:hypothetical protein